MNGYTNRRAPGVAIVAPGNVPTGLRQQGELRMAFSPGTPRQTIVEDYMRLAANHGADYLSGVVIDNVRERLGRRVICRVTFAPQATTRTEYALQTDYPEAPRRTSTRSVGGYESERKQVCGSKRVTKWRHESVSVQHYDYSSRRYRTERRLEYKPHESYDYVCETKTVSVWKPGTLNYDLRTVSVPRTRVVPTQVTTWSEGASRETCRPTESEVGGVIHGTAYFRGSVPSATRMTHGILVPKAVDCSTCVDPAVARPTCSVAQSAESAGDVAAGGDGGGGVIVALGTMDSADDSERELRARSGGVARFAMKDGTEVAGRIGRVHAWKCVVLGDDGASREVDLLEAAEVRLEGPRPEAESASCSMTPPVECPAICAAHMARVAGETVRPLAERDPLSDEGTPASATSLVVSDLDGVQDAEAMLLHHVGRNVTLVMQDGEEVTGRLGRVHASVATIRPAEGQSRYIKLVDVRAVRIGVATGAD